MRFWTDQQWIVFFCTFAGLCAATAFGVLGWRAYRTWTAPATYRVATPTARPTVTVAADRRHPRVLPPIVLDYTSTADTEIIEHLAPGPGSLPALLAAEPTDPDMLTRMEVAERDYTWVTGRSTHLYDACDRALTAAVDDFEAAIESAMRTARKWRLQGEGSYAVQALTDWRINTDTGEWPLVAIV